MIEYIYYLIDHRDDTVRYVGKSKNPKNRFRQHLKKLDKQMTPKRKWLEGLFKKDLIPTMRIIEKVTEENGREREQYHLNLNTDTALNIHNPKKGAKSRDWK